MRGDIVQKVQKALEKRREAEGWERVRKYYFTFSFSFSLPAALFV